MTDELVNALARVIEKHLPGSARGLGWSDMKTGGELSTSDLGHTDTVGSPPLEAEDEGGSSRFFGTEVHIVAGDETGIEITRYSQSHATLLLWASIQGERWFHASFDAEPLGRLARALREAQIAIQDLSPSVQSRLSWALALYNSSKSVEAMAGSIKAADVIRRLQDATQLASDDVRARPRPGRGRNWRAAAVADACRTVWAFEKWVEEERSISDTTTLEDAAGVGDVPQATWEEYLKKSAPSYAKDGDPGPFGKLLEDVIAALRIVGRDGEPVSAASALRARKQGRAQLEQKR